jgi:Flp pilus assembly protein TadD
MMLRLGLAWVCMAMGEYNRAISRYQGLLEVDADPARVYNNMGIAYF